MGLGMRPALRHFRHPPGICRNFRNSATVVVMSGLDVAAWRQVAALGGRGRKPGRRGEIGLINRVFDEYHDQTRNRLTDLRIPVTQRMRNMFRLAGHVLTIERFGGSVGIPC